MCVCMVDVAITSGASEWSGCEQAVQKYCFVTTAAFTYTGAYVPLLTTGGTIRGLLARCRTRSHPSH